MCLFRNEPRARTKKQHRKGKRELPKKVEYIWKIQRRKKHCRIKYERRNYITTSPQNLSLLEITAHIFLFALAFASKPRSENSIRIHFRMQCIVVCTFIVCSQCVRMQPTANYTERILTRKFSSESFVFALALRLNVRRIFNQKEMKKNVRVYLKSVALNWASERMNKKRLEEAEEAERERGKKIGTKSHRVSRRWWEYRKLSGNILIYEYLWKSLYVLLLLLRLLFFSLFLPNINSKHTSFKYACVLGLVIVMGESESEMNLLLFKNKKMLENWRQNYQMYNKEADSPKWTQWMESKVKKKEHCTYYVRYNE